MATEFDLSFFFGTAPQDYPYARVPYPSNSSLLSLLTDQVLPFSLAVNNTRATDVPAYIIVQSGGLRFDVFAGAFTKNDQLTASPFTNAFVYIANITLNEGQKVLAGLNGDTSVARRSLKEDGEEQYEARYHEWVREMADVHFAKRDEAENLTLGYVTSDVRFHCFLHFSSLMLSYSPALGSATTSRTRLYNPSPARSLTTSLHQPQMSKTPTPRS